MGRPMNEVLRGAAAGAIGTAALELVAPIERAIVGDAPPFSPRQLAAAILRRVAPDARRRRVARLGRAMRWTYGPGLGIAYALLAARSRRPLAQRSLLLGAAIFGFELIALPAVVGTQLYRPRTLAALALHVAAFAALVPYADQKWRARTFNA